MEKLTDKEQKAIDAFMCSVEDVEREDPTAPQLTAEEEMVCRGKKREFLAF